MSIAPVLASPGLQDPDQRVILGGIDWWQFETFLAIRGDHAGVRVTYMEGQLEIMSPSQSHEMLAKRIARLLEAIWKNEELKAYELREGAYVEIAQSAVIPGLAPSFIRQFLDCETQTEAVRKLRSALRSL
jgi:Uma2 family endonuclease